jgi:hypothetical protein
MRRVKFIIKQIIGIFVLFLPYGTRFLGKYFLLPPNIIANKLFVANINPKRIKNMVIYSDAISFEDSILINDDWEGRAIALPYYSSDRKFDYEFEQGSNSAFHLLHCCLIEYHNGRDYRQHEMFIRFCEWIEEGNVNQMNDFQIKTAHDVVTYVEKYISIYESIKNEGFKFNYNDRLTGIAISKNGEPHKNANGRHRLMICLVLGIKSIPVSVQKINKEYFNSYYKNTIFPIIIVRKIIKQLSEN